MKFKPIFLLLGTIAILFSSVKAATSFGGGLSALASFARQPPTSALTDTPLQSNPSKLSAKEGDVSDLELNAIPTFSSTMFDKYKLPQAKKEAEVHAESTLQAQMPSASHLPTATQSALERSGVESGSTNAQPARQTTQTDSSLFQSQLTQQLQDTDWRMDALQRRAGAPKISGADVPAQQIITRSDAPELKQEEEFQTPLNVLPNPASMSGRVRLGLHSQGEGDSSPDIAALKAKLASAAPRTLPQAKSPVDSLKSVYQKLFNEYKAENAALQNLKQKYYSEKEVRNKAEKEYESLRDSLQFQAHELAQDLTVAKIDAADLLKSRESARAKVAELKELEKEQAEHLSLLQRKHDYLNGAYELLKNKQQALLDKKTSLTAQREALQKSQADYEVKLRNLQAQIDSLHMGQAEVHKSKVALRKNRDLVQQQEQQMKIRQKERQTLQTQIATRKAALEDAKKRLAALKNECAGKMKTIMEKIQDLEGVKSRNNDQMKVLAKDNEALEFEKSKLDEKLALLEKKERVLRQRESDYQVKEHICHCRRLKQLNDQEMIVKNPFQVWDMRELGAPESVQLPLTPQLTPGNVYQAPMGMGMPAPGFGQPIGYL